MADQNLTAGIIILAAGSSSRLGRPKQNLVFKGKTLLQRAVETALASVCDTVVVVLGASADVILQSIINYPITIVQNDKWEEGMASSVRAGISELTKIIPNAQSAILLLCDQPFMDTYLLNHLILSKTRKGITVCCYNETVGPPALFDAIYFDDLLLLKGAEGAKKVIQKYPENVSEIPFPKGSIDIDTIEDFEKIN